MFVNTLSFFVNTYFPHDFVPLICSYLLLKALIYKKNGYIFLEEAHHSNRCMSVDSPFFSNLFLGSDVATTMYECTRDNGSKSFSKKLAP